MSDFDMIIAVFAMAVVTYLIRMLPLTFVKRKIKSRYIRSVLYYIPYCVLSAMTFPYIFYSTGNIYTALIGSGVALALAFFKRPLIVVALFSCLSVLLFGFII